jgi:hypothetical protein
VSCSSVPQEVPRIRSAAFLRRLPRGRFADLSGTLGGLRRLACRYAALGCLRLALPPSSPVLRSLAPGCRTRTKAICNAAPAPRAHGGEDETSQVPGRPFCVHAPLSDPAGSSPPRPWRCLRCRFPSLEQRQLRNPFPFEALSRSLHTLCVRFAAEVALGPRNTRFRPVANLCRAGLPPARSHRRFLSCSSVYIASSFTKLRLAQSNMK